MKARFPRRWRYAGQVANNGSGRAGRPTRAAADCASGPRRIVRARPRPGDAIDAGLSQTRPARRADRAATTSTDPGPRSRRLSLQGWSMFWRATQSPRLAFERQRRSAPKLRRISQSAARGTPALHVRAAHESAPSATCLRPRAIRCGAAPGRSAHRPHRAPRDARWHRESV